MTNDLQRIAILGGCGHVGLPLALAFADKGCPVTIVDIDAAAVSNLRKGIIPFREEGAQPILRAHLGENLTATTDSAALGDADSIICIVGTPIDAHLNPQLDKLMSVVDKITPHLRPSQLFVLRSTVFPGATARIAQWIETRVSGIDVAFCPERVAQGYALKETGAHPQIVSGTSARAVERARYLFEIVAPKVIELETIEAELAKLFCNAWRYITFAAANQFYTLCAQNGVDFYRIYDAITEDYPRMRGLPRAGLAAGPCLFKDTMQLSAFYDNAFSLGHSAMLVNEGLPRIMMQQLRPLGLADKTAGLLGMTFKGENDDTRESLAYKLRKLLALECAEVLCTDEYARDPRLLPLERVLATADFLVIGAPHERYKTIARKVPILDVWNHLGQGGLLR
jgi:UDP-N-acetyl-D-mannosaminuronic acid dehydrogenase